jgi:hypothetical protein
MIDEKIDVNKTEIFDGDEIPNDGKNYYIDVSRGYDGDADELYLVEFTKKTKENPYYQAQVRSRKEQLEKAAEWDELMKNIDAIRAANLEADERALLNKLKKKYPTKRKS